MSLPRLRVVLATILLQLMSALPGLAQTSVPMPAPPSDKTEKVDMVLDWKALPTYAGFYIAQKLGAF